MRALLYGKDPTALAFLKATEDVGLHLDYNHNLGENRIGCISIAFNAYQRVGEKTYTEGGVLSPYPLRRAASSVSWKNSLCGPCA